MLTSQVSWSVDQKAFCTTWIRWLCALSCMVCAAVASAFDTSIARHVLPVQAQQVLSLIQAGGPFPYEKDGTVFGNRERLLPSNKRGYYREYTVVTPGLHHRGARRIVCGGMLVQQPDACYYTDDHYASFRRIVD